MSYFGSLTKSKVAKRLVIYVLIFSSIVTLILTGIQLYRDYKYDLSLIESKFIEIELTHKKVIEDHLWLLNTSSISLLLDGILRHPDIAYLEIVDDRNQLVMIKGDPPTGDSRNKKIKLDYNYRNKNHYLGELKLIATLDHVYDRLIKTAFVILITQAIKTFLVSLFIMAIVWSLVTRHLIKIKNYALKIELENNQDDLKLDRQENASTHSDEFNLLVNAINLMRRKLYNSYIEIEHQSLHDSLTGLPNRRLMEDRLEHELALSERQQIYSAALFIDLDHFKLLNDSLGHILGDQILIETSKRLTSGIRKGDTAARIGGDEFVILLSLLSDKNNQAKIEAKNVAYKLQTIINKKQIIESREYSVTASIGICIFMGGEDSCENIIKSADVAMYQAKESGRNQICQFQSYMQDTADVRLSLEQKLIEAVKSDQFSLYYQPKFNTSREICSAEVLLRWKQPDGKFIPPVEFIPIAEETGLIVTIGYRVITKVFHKVAIEKNAIINSGVKSIAINISPRQFREPGFAEHVIALIDKFNLDASFFILEVTEEAVVRNIPETIKTMTTLKRHGFKLSIDDFGTGYSSLRYLKDFPLDELKIDKSFIDHIVDEPDDNAIVRSIITMAHNLKLDIVAEGVEREDQFQILLENDCQIFQGYLLSKPVDSHAFFKQLSA